MTSHVTHTLPDALGSICSLTDAIKILSQKKLFRGKFISKISRRKREKEILLSSTLSRCPEKLPIFYILQKFNILEKGGKEEEKGKLQYPFDFR